MKYLNELAPIFDKHQIPEALRPDIVSYITTIREMPERLRPVFHTRPYKRCVRDCLRFISKLFLEEVERNARPRVSC